ncbi:MAG TPA: hypothetical protein DCE75_10750 [Acidimicrobiaceae bacterium]|nr:hypothetical protein [Acidimicrobiaceae bacterium]
MALAVSMLAGACGDSSTDQTVVESDADSTTAVDETTSSASQAEETASTSDSDNADQTSDSGSQATSETEEQASGSDDADASQSGSAHDDYEAEEDTAEKDTAEKDYEAASQPEVAGEDCDEVKDRNELRLDIEGPAAVIVNDVARPGDECDFHMLYIDGMSRSVNSNGIVQLSITCDNPNDVEVALSGPGGFDYRHGANNGKRYECGDTWTESVNYQSDKVFFTVYIRPLRETGASSYQVVALPAPT